MLSKEIIIFQYLCPLLGAIFANLMFAAPVHAVREAVSKGTLGHLNPTPWAIMTGNCVGWITYSYLIQNQFIFWANAPGLIISVWLNMAAAKLQYCDRLEQDMRRSVASFLHRNRGSFVIRSSGESEPLGGAIEHCDGDDSTMSQTESIEQGGDKRPKLASADGMHTFENLTKLAYEITIQKTEAPAPHERVVVGIVLIWLVLITSISFLKINLTQKVLIIGVAVNINISFFYAAPLSTIVAVLRTSDSSSIHRWTMITNFLCALFFMVRDERHTTIM
jgi:solute carrier family 50 protein (sugar transporter)